jgi:putative protease
MNRSFSKPELLAPVQDWKTLTFIKNIPDAIYFGVNNYNMRQQAQNFAEEDLPEIASYCHSLNPPLKAYLCTNILIYNSELDKLENLIKKANEADIDAIIAHDLAAIQFAKKYHIPFHVSTQANVSNIISAKLFEEMGAERIILARELSLKQINEISRELEETPIECFIHGAMCTSISGRCYFSATIKNSEHFSANRGNCIQSCRRQWRVFDDQSNEFIYDGQMFLNAKDLCMIEHIPELIRANIDAFKIEGRMKNPLYVKTVASCYRDAINSYYEGTYLKEKVENWLEELSKVYNRGFHTGFYFHQPTAEDIQLTKRGNISHFKKEYIGSVLSYNKATKTANIVIERKGITMNVGDKLIIEGDLTYTLEIVRNLLLKGKGLKSIKRKKDAPPKKINITLANEVLPEDKVYLVHKTS